MKKKSKNKKNFIVSCSRGKLHRGRMLDTNRTDGRVERRVMTENK